MPYWTDELHLPPATTLLEVRIGMHRCMEHAPYTQIAVCTLLGISIVLSTV